MPKQKRTATVSRNTQETQIRMTLALDGKGHSSIRTGIPFLDHMLASLARHGLWPPTRERCLCRRGWCPSPRPRPARRRKGCSPGATASARICPRPPGSFPAGGQDRGCGRGARSCAWLLLHSHGFNQLHGAVDIVHFQPVMHRRQPDRFARRQQGVGRHFTANGDFEVDLREQLLPFP